jgi:DNA (cytosine-5)-methyltransferase 1
VNVALPAAFNVLSLFSGGGGLDLGIRLAVPHSRVVGYVEREAYAASVLVARMETADLDPAPVWDDVVAFDGRPWRGLVDCVAGGFPCQDISNAGQREGIEGSRSGLWLHFARIIREVQPQYVFVENVAALAVRGLDVVLADLASLWFDAEWGVLGADSVGAPHQRERLFILAHTRRDREQRLQPEPERRGGGAPASRGAGVADSASQRDREPHDASSANARERPRLDAGGRGGIVGNAALRGRDACAARGRDARSEGEARGSGGAVVHPAINGRKQGRTECAGLGGKPAPLLASGELADSHVAGLERQRLSVGIPKEQPCADIGIGTLADTERGGRWRRSCVREGQPDIARRCAPFPPGPDDRAGWEAYLREWPGTEPAIRRGSDGLAHRMERLRLLGNGVVPQQAAAAFGLLWERLHE